MQYRRLGKTGIDISALGFGCMRLPVIDNKTDRINTEESARLLHYAIDNGVNYIDTAYFYHAPVFGQRGESEPFVGNALSGGWRKRVNLATKMPLFLVQQKEQMQGFLDEQLMRLKTNYLDFYLLHALTGESWDRMLKLGIVEFLERMKNEGKIKFPAFSFHGELKDFKRIVDAYDWAYAQIQYNYMDINFQAGYEGLKYAAAKGTGVVVMEPLKGGKLASNLPQEMTAIFDTLETKRSPAEWALRYVWNEQGVSSLLSGMNTMAQLEENLEIAGSAVAGNLSDGESALYDSLRQSVNAKIKADCTACRYCMPCSSGVEIPEILAALNNSVRWSDSNPWLTGYTVIKGKAGKCTECRECEEICPQGLPISSLMKDAVSIFKS